METTLLGRTGMRVSRLCMGTMSFGREADEAESGRIYAACREAGIDFFDCANIYSEGRAEEMRGDDDQRHRNDVPDESELDSEKGYLEEGHRDSKHPGEPNIGEDHAEPRLLS